MTIEFKQPDNEPHANKPRSRDDAFQPTPMTVACLPADTTGVMLYDSHAHLDAPAFDADREQVLQAARAAGVVELLVPAITAATWPQLHALCAPDPHLHAAYGLHPCYMAEHADADLDKLDVWLANHAAIAVGECGLDGPPDSPDRPRQLRLLRGQFEIASRRGLPLVLHAQHAFEQVILELQRFGKPLRGVVHSFSGSAEQARRLRDLGFCVGIGGPLTYERAQRLRKTIASLPLDSLLLETDSPDQPGAAHRGQRNEPAYLVEVLACLAQLRKESPARIAAATYANAQRVFAAAHTA